ncbi:unnamed protein product [Eruca vesicaria subsp. sativa]|uniref:Uncharacterized protein n=1 Tax=Eruca vesicaria subsp. sativa TaxID=29727 RepID=A0ABC8JK97_ERUVS|nr:unnamed protein product [Eruca vesicaria subsp. sativa]
MTKTGNVMEEQEAVVRLSELEQSPPAAVLKSIQPFLNAVIKPEILKHQDKDVKLLVASCLSVITRITAPEAPLLHFLMLLGGLGFTFNLSLIPLMVLHW